MTPLFHYELLNPPFGDPVLYIRFAEERKALLFDLGQISHINAGKIFRVSDAFVTHTHMDHFIGLDHLVRLNLARNRIIRIYGPEGIIRNVKGRLKGYTWDLVGQYSFELEVVEIGAARMKRVSLQCRDRFAAGPVRTEPFGGDVDVQPHYTVRALRLDHKIISIAYCLEERFHININKERLRQMNLPTGPWLGELKDLIRAGKPDSRPVRIGQHRRPTPDDREAPLGELKRQIATITRGQKIVYISDCRGIEKNFKKIISFSAGADVMFCEAAFLDEDSARASERGHLTAGQAGMLAREAGARELKVFHFSPRYESCPERLYREAEQAFRGAENGVSNALSAEG